MKRIKPVVRALHNHIIKAVMDALYADGPDPPFPPPAKEQ